MNKFEILQKLHVTKELRNRVENKVLECLDKARARFGPEKVTKIPKIQFNTKGTAGGWAHWNEGNPFIRINPILLNENVEQVIEQTVPHEVAHIVVNEVYKPSMQWSGWGGRRVRTVASHGWDMNRGFGP